jgi:hypothetical protein
MHKFWFDYVKTCYDLVVESEEFSDLKLEHTVEAYVVHLMAKNFNRTDIGNKAVAIQLLEAVNSKNRSEYVAVGDECLLIHSYPLKQNKWPNKTYYSDMGTTAYGLAGHEMENHFLAAAKILNVIFSRSLAK